MIFTLHEYESELSFFRGKRYFISEYHSKMNVPVYAISFFSFEMHCRKYSLKIEF